MFLLKTVQFRAKEELNGRGGQQEAISLPCGKIFPFIILRYVFL